MSDVDSAPHAASDIAGRADETNDGPPLVLNFSGSFDVGQVERRMQPLQASEIEQTLVLDLQNIRWADVSALTLVIAIIRSRSKSDRKTKIRVPKSRVVRDFLRAWKFADGIRESTGISFRELVPQSDHKFFGESQLHYLPRSATTPWTGLVEQLVSSRFFGFCTYRLTGNNSDLQMIESEGARWRSPAIKQTLGNHLKGASGDLVRVIIFELIANVIQHPGACRASIVSHVNLEWESTASDSSRSASRTNDANFFTLCIWDDGLPIVDTLRAASIGPNGPRVSRAFSGDEFVTKADGWSPSRDVYPVSWTPNHASANAEFLLASLFPGISQKAARNIYAVRTDDGHGTADAGMGLHALYKSVIDDFGGSVAIRSGDLFANVKRAPGGRAQTNPTYRAKLVQMADHLAISGNMITIRLPLVR